MGWTAALTFLAVLRTGKTQVGCPGWESTIGRQLREEALFPGEQHPKVKHPRLYPT